MLKVVLGLFCAGAVGLAGATIFVYDYDVDGRLISTTRTGDSSIYTLTPSHNFSGTMAMGDVNTNGMPDSLEAYLANVGGWGEEYDPFQCDSDGDGMCDWNEWMLGTDPFSYDSVFSTWPSGGYGGGIPDSPIDFTVGWSSIPFRTYAVKFKPSLMEAEWNVLTNNVEATPPINFWTHEQTTNVCGFYRVVQVTNTAVNGGEE